MSSTERTHPHLLNQSRQKDNPEEKLGVLLFSSCRMSYRDISGSLGIVIILMEKWSLFLILFKFIIGTYLGEKIHDTCGRFLLLEISLRPNLIEKYVRAKASQSTSCGLTVLYILKDASEEFYSHSQAV